MPRVFKKALADGMKRAEFRALRKAVLQRDNFTCTRCGKNSPTGQGLAITPITTGSIDLDNLTTLCKACRDGGPAKKPEYARAGHKEETFERPGWHAWVYGGANRPGPKKAL